MYTYRAYVTSVYDGDTVTVDIDLGMNVTLEKQKIRLYGIDTPELRGEERDDGLVARDLMRRLVLDKWVVLKTYRDKTGKYGRYLGELFVRPDIDELFESETSTDYININQWMIDNGYAKVY